MLKPEGRNTSHHVKNLEVNMMEYRNTSTMLKIDVSGCKNTPDYSENSEIKVIGHVSTSNHIENLKIDMTGHVSTPHHLENSNIKITITECRNTVYHVENLKI